MNDGIRMQISAFVDGELPENEAELLIRRLSQDNELRLEVAEYLALGRLMRAEAGLSGADRLHTRVVAEIDEKPSDKSDSANVTGAAKFVRPLAGFAIAAGVALAAIFALQQTALDDNIANDVPQVATADEAQSGVPNMDAQLERRRSIFRRHAETTSRYGAGAINSEVVDLRFSEEIDEPESIRELQESLEDSADELDEAVQD